MSPSNIITGLPVCLIESVTKVANVVFPDPDKPVIQITLDIANQTHFFVINHLSKSPSRLFSFKKASGLSLINSRVALLAPGYLSE